MQIDDTTCVLLHGAGMGAWAWRAVVDRMETPAIALDVPGRRPGVTPEGCATELVREIDERGLGEVVLVAHSLAGVLVPTMARLLDSRVRRCVYLASVVPPPGGSFVDAVGLANGLVLRALFRFNRDGLKPSPAMIRKSLCNDLDEATTEMVVSRYAAEYPGLYLEPAGTLPDIPTTYIRLTHDHAVTRSQQEASIGRLRAPRVRQLEAGHLAMLSMPTGVAAAIDEEVAQL